MKFSTRERSLGAILLALILSSCGGADAESKNSAGDLRDTPDVSLDRPSIGDAVLEGIYDEAIQLEGGRWEGEPWVEGGAARPTVLWLSRLSHQGDLDGDRRRDVLAYFNENGGGTGQMLYLAWLVEGADGGPLRSRSVHRIGDRVQVIRAELADDVLTVRLIAGGPGDAACCPNQVQLRRYRFAAGNISEEVEIVGPATLDEVEGSSWVLASVGRDRRPLEGERPTLQIENGRVSGFGGCNRYSASIVESQNKDIEIGPVAATKMACPPPASETEAIYTRLLTHASRWGFMMGQFTLMTADGEDFSILHFDRVESR